MKLRIAQVTNLHESVPPAHPHGLEQVVSDLTEELVKRGHDVTLFSTRDSKTSARLIPMWPFGICRDQVTRQYLPDYSTVLAMHVLSKVFDMHKQFDVIHDHTRFVAPYFAKLISTPIVSTIHHPVSHPQEEGYKKILPREQSRFFRLNWENKRREPQTVVLSKFQADKYSGKCRVIYNGLPIDDWIFKQNSENYFAYLGYISPDKGAAEAIQSVILANEKLILAGSIDDSEFIQSYFTSKIQPFLGDRIQYIGRANFSDKMRLLSGAKAALMPVQWDEPFGLVAIESMACGTPVIAFNRGALGEIIKNGETGFVVETMDEMIDAIHNVHKIDRRKCRSWVEKNFTVNRMVDQYEELYSFVIKKSK